MRSSQAVPKRTHPRGAGPAAFADKQRQRRQSSSGPALLSGLTDQQIDGLPDAFYTLDENFRFVRINSHAEQYWGRSRAELVGQHIWTAFPQAVGSEAYEAHIRALDRREEVTLDTRSPVLDIVLHVRVQPLLDGLAVYFRPLGTRSPVSRSAPECVPSG